VMMMIQSWQMMRMSTSLNVQVTFVQVTFSLVPIRVLASLHLRLNFCTSNHHAQIQMEDYTLQLLLLILGTTHAGGSSLRRVTHSGGSTLGHATAHAGGFSLGCATARTGSTALPPNVGQFFSPKPPPMQPNNFVLPPWQIVREIARDLVRSATSLRKPWELVPGSSENAMHIFFARNPQIARQVAYQTGPIVGNMKEEVTRFFQNILDSQRRTLQSFVSPTVPSNSLPRQVAAPVTAPVARLPDRPMMADDDDKDDDGDSDNNPKPPTHSKNNGKRLARSDARDADDRKPAAKKPPAAEDQDDEYCGGKACRCYKNSAPECVELCWENEFIKPHLVNLGRTNLPHAISGEMIDRTIEEYQQAGHQINDQRPSNPHLNF